MAKKPKVPVYDRLPNAYEHANRTVYLPPSKALGSFRDLNREEPGFWGSDGERWHLLAAEEQLPVTVPPPTDGTTFITNINNVKITHGHRWRIFNGDTITAKDYYQYIIVDNIIVDEGAEIIVEEFGDFIVLGDREGDDTLVKVGNTLFIDDEYGVVAGERENFIVPYDDGGNAETDAIAGDCVEFRAGVHVASGLGKNGVTYHIKPGAKITPDGHLFTDGGVAMTIWIQNDGEIELTSQTLLLISNPDTVIYFRGNGPTHTGILNNIIFDNAGGTLYIDANRSQQPSGANSRFIRSRNANAFTICKINDVISGMNVVRCTGGEVDIQWNKLKTFSTSSNTEAGLFAASGGVIRARSGYWEHETSVNISKGIQSNGGIIHFEGHLDYTNTVSGATYADACDMVGGGANGELHIKNAKIINRSTGATLSTSIIRMDEDKTNWLTVHNSEFINYGTLAQSNGIYWWQTINSNAGQSNADLHNVVIRLHSTAVAAGAKAQKVPSGSLNYRMYSDCISNGIWHGTNLVTAGPTGLVDAEVKSD